MGWIGTTIAVEAGAVVLGINRELWAELTVMAKDFLKGNVIALRVFRKFTGKVQLRCYHHPDVETVFVRPLVCDSQAHPSWHSP